MILLVYANRIVCPLHLMKGQVPIIFEKKGSQNYIGT